SAADSCAVLHRNRIRGAAEVEYRVVGGLDTVGDPHRVEHHDVPAGFSIAVGLGDLQRAYGDGVCAAPRRGRVGRRVFGTSDLHLQVEPDGTVCHAGFHLSGE